MHLVQTKFVNPMRATGRLCPSSIVHRYVVLHAGLDYAVKIGILKKNPCDGVELPRIEKVERPMLNEAQIDALLLRFKGHWLQPIIVSILKTGFSFF